ncbi:hypothetical protein PHYPSEUDO_008385 [Phytophthora pseudosyringae]|uniref:RxLR effector protein n=1 Tax=Phytophthora pseudosyringae TaxID=221518 RepID=A0A8T1W9L6_9STRA|nr:hypothetical protein PHYPSEUDO_008385 [Phytophthora pseudosyringae]
MRLPYILLVTVAALLASTSVYSATAEIIQASRLDNAVTADRDAPSNKGRSLRLVRTSNDNDDAGEDSTDDEERGFLSNISDKILLSIKTGWWLERRKSAEYVKKKLGLVELEGVALTRHVNYRRFVKYVDKLEENEIWTLVYTKRVSTTRIWDNVKLYRGATAEKNTPLDDVAAQLKGVQGTETFRYYRRYAIAFDDHMVSLFGSGYDRPTRFFDDNATPIEKFARAQFWAEKGRRKDHVKEFLGLRWAKPAQVDKDPYYQYYLKVAGELEKNKASTRKST